MNIDLIKFFEEADKIYPFEGVVATDYINSYIGEFKIIDLIKYKGEIIKVDGVYLIKADINYLYETNCDRCFETTIKEVNTSLSGKLEDYGKQYEDSVDDEYDIIYYKKGILDLNEYILMEVSASLPMKTLCNENCKGLCPRCGVDLNRESCTCRDDYIDPRFEKLKDYFVDK